MKSEKLRYGYGEMIIFEEGFMRVARSPHKLKCPKKLDNNLTYLSGYHLGDGYSEDIYKSHINRGKRGYELTYADEDIKQLELINSIFKDKFNHTLKIYKRPNVNLWIGRTNCKTLHWFLTKKLGLQTGERKIIKIPTWILSEKIFFTSFLSGFFDADGDVSKNINKNRHGKIYSKIRIQLTQKDKGIILKIKNLLYDIYGIKSSIFKKHKQESYILKIDARNAVNIFKEKINFRNLKKREKLENLAKEIKYKQPRKLRKNQG